MSHVPPSGDAPFTDCSALRHSYLGDWAVFYSTLKMWTNGEYQRPVFRFQPLRDGNERTLVDTTFAQKDLLQDENKRNSHPFGNVDPKAKTMVGHNTQYAESDKCHIFKWKGTGLLAWTGVSMDWRIAHYDIAHGIATSCGTKTTFTEPGCNIVVRDPSLYCHFMVEDAGPLEGQRWRVSDGGPESENRAEYRAALQRALDAVSRQTDSSSYGIPRPAAGNWPALFFPE